MAFETRVTLVDLHLKIVFFSDHSMLNVLKANVEYALFIFKNKRHLNLLKSQWKWANRKKFNAKKRRIWGLCSRLQWMKKGFSEFGKSQGGEEGTGGRIYWQEFRMRGGFHETWGGQGQFLQIQSGLGVYILNFISYFCLTHFITALPMFSLS